MGRKLLGEDHARTAHSYHSLGVTQHLLGDYTSALQSDQGALDVRIKVARRRSCKHSS